MQFKDLFKQYDPPKNGLITFRERLAFEENKQYNFLPNLIYAGSAALVLIVILSSLLLPAFYSKTPDTFSLLARDIISPALFESGYTQEPTDLVSSLDKFENKFAVLNKSTTSDQIIFYWVTNQ